MNRYQERSIISHVALHKDCDCKLCEWCGGSQGLIESYPPEVFQYYRKEWAWLRNNYKLDLEKISKDPTAPNLSRIFHIIARDKPKNCVSLKCVLLDIECTCILNTTKILNYLNKENDDTRI